MRRFDRQEAPEFWKDFDERWRLKLSEAGLFNVNPLRWVHGGRSLAHWFHQTVRPASEPKLCAYCDGALAVTSGENIDHFEPVKLARHRALDWANLFPACSLCNSHYKRDRCPWGVAKPDRDPVDTWFEFDPGSGELRARLELGPTIRLRVRRAIWMFQLNTKERCNARRRVFKEIVNARLVDDASTLEYARSSGPYRFIVEAYLASQP